MSKLESDYFVTLVNKERAGTYQLKNYLNEKLKEIRVKSKSIKNRLSSSIELSELDKARFYSSWIYSAIRLLTSIPDYQERSSLIKSLDHKKATINEVIDFLVSRGLCTNENDQLKMGSSKTHIGDDSPLVWQHHQNWRLKAFERHLRTDAEELFFTSPLTISKKDMGIFRERIIQLIESLSSIVNDTKPEELACINIDWFKVL